MVNEGNSLTELSRVGDTDSVPDEFYRTIAKQPRRRILAFLLEQGASTREELADVLCGWESTTGRMVPPERHEDVRIDLHHVHLPQLVDAGLITYDYTEGHVALTDISDSMQALLSRTIEDDRK